MILDHLMIQAVKRLVLMLMLQVLVQPAGVRIKCDLFLHKQSHESVLETCTIPQYLACYIYLKFYFIMPF